jgi:hypothetical protein
MKKTLFLTLALGLASALPLAAQVNLYITGSTAFRKQVYTACTKLFNGGAPSVISYGDLPHGGDGTIGNGNTSWVMSGNAASTITNLSGGQFIIHGLFTGSIQGLQSVENAQGLIFAQPGLNAAIATAYVTNAPTIAFSDTASAATPSYDASLFSGLGEEQVAVQPFVFVKSLASSGAVTSITNISWEQIRYAYLKGRIPYSSWTGLASDTNTYVYLANRTLDSGTRVTTLSEVSYPYNQSAIVYIFDTNASAFYLANNSLFHTNGLTGFGVVGSAPGNGNANLAWGPGYIAGGDLRAGLKYTDPNNQAIGYLSLSDAQSAGASGNWGTVISFNGYWPTAAGPGINGEPNSATNNFAPVSMGNYPFWSYEVVVYPTGGNSDVTAFQLGDQQTGGTILGVLDSQTIFNGGSPIAGSLENEIQNSKTASGGATAIRLSDMQATRGSVGGTIFPTAAP